MTGGVELRWLAVTQDEGGGTVTAGAYQVWRSSAPYFRPWDAGVNLVAETPATTPTTTTVDSIALTAGTRVFYGGRSVAQSGLLSATSAHVGAFAYGLVKGAAQ